MRCQDQFIIQNTGVFREYYVPQEIVGRQEQAGELLNLLEPIKESRIPIHCWLYGQTGTGKTTTGRWVMRKLEKESAIQGLYINCWENQTFFSVLDYLTRELRMFGADKLSTSFKLDRIKRHISDKHMIIFLDEIDQPSPRQRNTILYNLSDLPAVGLICACNSHHTYFDLDIRVRSRLDPVQIFFERYPALEILGILNQRVQQAFTPDGYTTELLHEIARISGGDARLALQTLKSAAYMAEKENHKQVTRQHIGQSWNSIRNGRKTSKLRKLTDHHRLLYRLICKNPNILSGDLWRLYLKTCRTKGLKAIAIRTYSDYCNKLLESGLVQMKRAPIKGKVREFNAIE